uniref:DNA-directed RNA polymerase n=1 Tax=Ascaris lumbricoides TaxID=6252 RepID=A0A0M3IVH1_ASCLU
MVLCCKRCGLSNGFDGLKLRRTDGKNRQAFIADATKAVLTTTPLMNAPHRLCDFVSLFLMLKNQQPVCPPNECASLLLLSDVGGSATSERQHVMS